MKVEYDYLTVKVCEIKTMEKDPSYIKNRVKDFITEIKKELTQEQEKEKDNGTHKEES